MDERPLIIIEPTVHHLKAVHKPFRVIPKVCLGYADVMFDLSGILEEDLPYVGILQSVLGIIDTEGYEYGEFGLLSA